ncbi:trafficking protein particle complex subunit 10 [Podospora aff. communis PSN243]|uniref:Trafficking protein particle complex subunit 10 n=1 Tax=Podospora aff. communis PSN243 TaxID=3040156 RepID=A0AAV9GAC6_9PEZI|nr:trafficking protein particle complex subunit 10 [Podospora aff. communis PSN243]
MEQPSSSSKVTVEYHDPHDVYKLLAPGLIPRLPLRDLHWQSHNGPVRSIQTLHVELVPAGSEKSSSAASIKSPNPKPADRDDGFQTAPIGGHPASVEQAEPAGTGKSAGAAGKERRHQIPGLRRTPYLKILLVRCDDNDTYKTTTRAEIREWIKTHTSSKPTSNAENHDASEWLIVHVVIPNTTAATQPRLSGSRALESSSDPAAKTAASRWRGASSTLLEKLRSDFNGSSKSAVDRVRQIRIGINDVPYDILPRVVPAVPTGYHESEQDSINAWADLIGKIKELILSCFDTRVSQYEEDIKERDGQRLLPGWNFCTFFILKEGLARGFESVGLVEDALVGYDELSVGLDAIIQEQAATGNAEAHGGALLAHTEELKAIAQKAIQQATLGSMDDEHVDLQGSNEALFDNFHNIPINSSKKAYRELILANNVSLFDFRCYIFARQISLLLRLGNASSSREELLAKLREQQELVPRGVAPTTPMPSRTDEAENLLHLAEICRRALQFVPAISTVARNDIMSSVMADSGDGASSSPGNPVIMEVVNNVVASFAFSVAQQILAQTSSKALPIPPSTLTVPDGHEPKAAIPEPKTMMHPARHSSLNTRTGQRPPPSPVGSPPGRAPEENTAFIRTGLEELAAQRAELYSLSRNILEECGKKRGWSGGWDAIPVVGEPGVAGMDDISLDDDDSTSTPLPKPGAATSSSMAGLNNELLRTALRTKDDFYRLYEILTDKTLRHYSVASHAHSIQKSMADLAVLKFHLGQYSEASFFFYETIPPFGEAGWTLLELSMLLMFAKCLKELRKLDDYVNKALRQLLCKAAAAEKERIQQKSMFRILAKSRQQYPEPSSMSGLFTDLLHVSSSLGKEVRIPLVSLFTDIELDGPPIYAQMQDSFSISLKLRSLIVDTFEATKMKLRINGVSGTNQEIWLETEGPVTINPGNNKIRLRSTTMVAGNYEVDQIRLSSANVLLHHERNIAQADDAAAGVLKNYRVNLYQRAGALDARLLATKEVHLGRNNALELEVLSGWNNVKSCEVKIRSVTGGVRLLMNEATVPGSIQPSKRSEGGVFTFGAFSADTFIKIRFPFTIENDLANVAVKADVSYSTENGDFVFSRTSSVPITLALGVNVQDVFKHNSLFSRFTVSTASDSPLRLFKSELLESDMFESQLGAPPSHPILIFAKQPASLLYRVQRKPGAKVTPKKKQTMHLRLHYSVVQEEIEELIGETLREELDQAGLLDYSALVVAKVVSLVHSALHSWELEKVALLGDVSTDFLSGVKWEKLFPGLGHMTAAARGDELPAAAIARFMGGWLKRHPKLSLRIPDPSVAQPKTIVIPVDIPPITIMHTADIQLQRPLPSMDSGTGKAGTEYPTVCTNQVLPATLHLKWTRIWDTAISDAARLAPGAKSSAHAGGRSQDLEFGYEITAPPDTWLLGGRRRGHFVIPAMPDPDGDECLTSTPDTEADIPLLLIPLREGWLPFPGVEIREVTGSPESGGGGVDNGGDHHCEMDYRNLGETVHVVADRREVTLSLDASGPGGGPLVLESQISLGLDGRVVA